MTYLKKDNVAKLHGDDYDLMEHIENLENTGDGIYGVQLEFRKNQTQNEHRCIEVMVLQSLLIPCASDRHSILKIKHFFEGPSPSWPQVDASVGTKYSDLLYWYQYVFPIINFCADHMVDFFIAWLKKMWKGDFSGNIVCQKKKVQFLMRHAAILDFMKSMMRYGLDPLSTRELIPKSGDKKGWQNGTGQQKVFAHKSMDALLFYYARYWELLAENQNHEPIFDQWGRANKAKSMKIDIPNSKAQNSLIDSDAFKYILDEDSFYNFCHDILCNERNLPKKPPELSAIPIPLNFRKFHKKVAVDCPVYKKHHHLFNGGTRIQRLKAILNPKTMNAQALKEREDLQRFFTKYGGDTKANKDDLDDEITVSDTDDDEGNKISTKKTSKKKILLQKLNVKIQRKIQVQIGVKVRRKNQSLLKKLLKVIT